MSLMTARKRAKAVSFPEFPFLFPSVSYFPCLDAGNRKQRVFLGPFYLSKTLGNDRKQRGPNPASVSLVRGPQFPSVSIFVSFGRFGRGMKTRALRPPIQLGLSHWLGVRGRRKSVRALKNLSGSFDYCNSLGKLHRSFRSRSGADTLFPFFPRTVFRDAKLRACAPRAASRLSIA